MLICQLQLNDIYHFIQHQKAENRLATVCEKDDAEFMTGGNNPIYFKFCTYSDDDIDRIMCQTEQWQIKCEKVEDWDPSFGHTQGRIKDDSVIKIDRKVVLVKNGEFSGVVDYSKDLGERYGLFCALISDYIDAPLHFRVWEGYGSSDHDMMHESNYYLQKV